jgi:uncharacterized protein DUF1097
MKQNLAIATSVGLLVWAWTFVSLGYLEPRVLTWVTFLTWASFYAAGAGKSGLAKSIASGIVGVLISAAVMWTDRQLGLAQYHLLVLSLLLGVLGWVLCALASIPLLGCIPASFIGAAAFFGASAPMDIKLLSVLCSIVIGAFLGLASQKLAGALTQPTAASSDAPSRQSVRP